MIDRFSINFILAYREPPSIGEVFFYPNGSCLTLMGFVWVSFDSKFCFGAITDSDVTRADVRGLIDFCHNRIST